MSKLSEKLALPKWYLEKPPIYDIDKTYLDNLQHGPFFQGETPSRIYPPKEEWIDLFGHPIASPLGVPAGPLLSAKWTTLAAKLGFDVVTYKTIRSKAYPSHPLPNMIYVSSKEQSRDHELYVIKENQPSSNIDNLSVTNSFGMPSMSPDFLMQDIERANQSLDEGQVMIVSVVGTPGAGIDFIEDFVNVACFAKEAGAEIIEANFSCPNIDREGGSLYLSPDSVFTLAKKLTEAIHPIPLIIKVGLFSSKILLQEVMIAAAKAGVRGFQGLNTIKRKVFDSHGNPGLDENRIYSGLCGSLVRDRALTFIQDASSINQKEKLGLTIMGVGGITSPEHFDQFIENGAKIALSATGMMWDPYLAARWAARRHNRRKT